jgi:hypothetical protein
MSYYDMTSQDYQPPAAGTPGWQLAPVPGWGMNPLRAGPRRLAADPITGDQSIPEGSVLPEWSPLGSEEDAQVGYISLAAAGGIFFGWFLAWAYLRNRKGG